ncbi:DUF2156 domain-containing protein [[Eubacterium] cellulosolvens]
MNIESYFPQYPEKREISINDKDLLKQKLFKLQPQISEYTFTNLWIWRQHRPVYLSQLNKTVLIFRKNLDGQIYLLPPVGEKVSLLVFEKMRSKGIKDLNGLYGFSKEEANKFKEKGLIVIEDRNNWDYVYSVKELISLEGTKYRKKRQNIHQCLSDHECVYKSITSQIIKECLELQNDWCNLRYCISDPGLMSEDWAIKEILTNFDKLSVFGGAIYIDGRIEAFTIAERLNSNSAVIHFEKANHNIRGLYQLINQWFCKHSLQDYEYVNREQDLGIQGLRRAKQEYYPHHMVEKCTIKIS